MTLKNIPHSSPQENYSESIQLFVYGTLKRGYANHTRFCAHAQSIEPAAVWGRLYHLMAGFPALEIPQRAVLAHGTTDPLADAQTQAQLKTPRFQRPTGDWDLIRGELVTFANPSRDLPSIDRLEGFRPWGRSLYRRVLVAAKKGRVVLPVWIYWMSPILNGERIGCEWPD
ncbi:gamma-glutamylcyclotransferase family protein [Hahella aquimaris]|uniref:gamma-glutamylcyclotransferase family protein n=1 Tax=Hahella sp. HNIBRBA332 TaxID=3015983 RepID=UPI00273B8CA3|nr:gamma-glutamylcyclotransferase family protein [Hahella sp. HNIBRBA332]WLQ13238.1 gamma-glutamylcyclotransferase family protein [Hahella sp. HNIBRBA332]